MINIGNMQGTLHKFVFEARYRFGFAYLDRCGRFINRLTKEAPEWILAGNISPQGAPLVSLRDGTQVSFDSYKYHFALEQQPAADALTREDLAQFCSEVEFAASVFQEEMALTEFTRVGFRVWYLFHADSKAASEKIVRELGFFKTADSVAAVFEGQLDAEGHTAIVKCADRSYRISANGVERQMQVDLGEAALSVQPHALSKGQREALLSQMRAAKRIKANPEFAMMIDVDAFMDDPKEIEPRIFIETSMDFVNTHLPRAFPKHG